MKHIKEQYIRYMDAGFPSFTSTRMKKIKPMHSSVRRRRPENRGMECARLF